MTTTKNNYLKTSEVIEVENYPYGFRLKTTLTDFIEFDKKKGYRHCTRTIDPRSGRVNNPKKSTYYPLMVRFYDENRHIKTVVFHFNGDKEINEGCKFISDNFELFTPEEIKYIYGFIQMMAKVDFQATCQYGGSNAEDLKPLYLPFLGNCKKGHETGENLFNTLVLDTEAINATKPKNYQPFKITSY
jgi:hypothetical protein